MQKPNQLLILKQMITETSNNVNEKQSIPLMTTFSFKQRTRFGTWNVRTLLDSSKLAQVCREAKTYNLAFLGLCETRWPDSGEFSTSDNFTMIYSGKPADQQRSSGVGILLSREARNAMIDWHPYSDRIITARLRTRARNITCIQCYAPTETSDTQTKEDFYSQLARVTSTAHRGDILLVMGDFNAQVGNDNSNREPAMGVHGIGRMTENGELFTEMCLGNKLVIGGTIFPHRKVHKATWVSPDHRTENQIDHIAISKTWRGSLLDVRNKRGADCSSDHHLLVGTIRLRVAAVKTGIQTHRKFDVQKLNDPNVKTTYTQALRNSAETNQNLTDEFENVRDLICDAAAKHIGYKIPERKPWISDTTWNFITTRKEIKSQMNNARTSLEKSRLQANYSFIDREVKRSARRDKRKWVENLATEAQTAAESGRTRDLYKTIKNLTNKKFNSSKPLRNSNGDLITSKNTQLQIWTHHYANMLSSDMHIPHPICNCTTHTERADIPVSTPTVEEIVDAIHALKNHKAPGPDNINPELLKVDPQTSAFLLQNVVKRLWDNNELSDELKEGLIINIPKKGDLTECRNWRGITLLSMINKIIANIINRRLSDSLDKEFRCEQAGFRSQKSCLDHINSLRIIIEQSVEWRSPLYLVFIDFEKAFDTLSHDAIWKALTCKGVPRKIIEIIQELYRNANCRILHQNSISDKVSVKAGVRQGCILSPLLFNVVLDIVMKNATANNRGIMWGLGERLADLDYADDICLLTHSHSDMLESLKMVESEAAKAGLKINILKTKAMRINSTCNRPFSIQNIQIQDVNTFCYLGSIITTTGGSSDDVLNRTMKARQAFGQLSTVWKSPVISTHTKINIFNSCVKSVLLYGCETWNMATKDVNTLQVFVNKCLRRILKIFWPNRISNVQLWERTHQNQIQIEVLRRKWRWIGHALRRSPDDVTRNAIDWNPQGSRRRGRPAHTWRRQLDLEALRAGKTWNEIKNLAPSRNEWRNFVEALCSL